MKKMRVISILICIATLLSLFVGFSFEVSADSSVTTVVAASDFQPKEGNSKGIKVVNNIISAMGKSGITSADGFLFCGDYDFGTFGNSEETREGIGLLNEALDGFVDPQNRVFAQGNHDTVPGTAGLSQGGDRDPKSGEYGVFVINNDDYMWYNKDEARIKRTAQRLINYLNEKLEQEYTKPIFVMSHLPLHYSLRTVQDGDGKYANYLFDVLNEAGAKGLNIIFLFGHDHSQGWDDYLGASSIYLEKGDTIQIADMSTTVFKTHTLNFTYMNAGYVGYYDVNNTGADGTLTMTFFRISSNGTVTVGRCSEKGLHNLKSVGVTNAYKNETAYPPNTKEYKSCRVLKPSATIDKTPIKELIKLTDSGRKYRRVDDLTELKDGGKYLLVYNAAIDQLLQPKVVEKTNNAGTRVGFELVEMYVFGEKDAYGKFESMEWTFTNAGEKWLLGYDEKYVSFTPTSDKAVTATLEDRGSYFNIEGEATYSFKSGDYYFNYNARELMNAYTADPAMFYIYEYVGYTVKVTEGKATVAGESVKSVKEGNTVTLTANQAPAGMRFDKWVVVDGDLTLSDATKSTLTFVMPSDALEISASYVADTKNDAASTLAPTVDDGSGSDEGGLMWIVIGSVGLVVVALCIGGIIFKKKRK